MTARLAFAAPTRTCVGTVSGKFVDLSTPDWTTIDFRDVAHGLARIRRFNGQSTLDICVADHSRRVAALAPKPFRLAALLHDSHEFAFGDLVTPALNALLNAAPDALDAVRGIKKRLDLAIALALLNALRPTPADDSSWVSMARHLAGAMRSPEVAAADAEAFAIEDSYRRAGCEMSRLGDPLLDLDDGAKLTPGAAWLREVADAARESFGPLQGRF